MIPGSVSSKYINTLRKKNCKGGCLPSNLKRALLLSGNGFRGCNQQTKRSVENLGIKVRSCQKKHDEYLELTGYKILFNTFFNKDGETILDCESVNEVPNKWTFCGSCSVRGGHLYEISEGMDLEVKLFYHEKKYKEDGPMEVLMMDASFLTHVIDAMMDQNEESFKQFTRDKDVNEYIKKIDLLGAIDHVLEKQGKHFLFGLGNKKNAMLMKKCIPLKDQS